ncbi:MAG: multiheme c-type cytochrome [Deltaproteobacteria bacterium]|nr:multiheme c-type cytochrome [Deltaproteobacteria bacterium]
MLEKNGFPAALCLGALLCLSACSPFAHLTEVNNTLGEAHGPKATDCGQCHIEQFGEWQESAHAQAFVNPRFQAMLIDGADDSCLGCHVPDTVRTNGQIPTPRNYHRQDGVSCAACHLSQGTMTGPEPESALFSPHPIAVQPEFFRTSGLCGTCHTETFSDWQASRSSKPATPTCQECHMPQIVRTATKGSNLFSKTLVAFEESRPTRQHTFGFGHLAGTPGLIEIKLLGWQPEKGGPLQLSVRNLLPHKLPTGSFRTRRIWINATLHTQPKTILEPSLFLGHGWIVLAGDGIPALAAEEARTLTIPIILAPGASLTSAGVLTVQVLLGPLAEEEELLLLRKAFILPISR